MNPVSFEPETYTTDKFLAEATWRNERSCGLESQSPRFKSQTQDYWLKDLRSQSLNLSQLKLSICLKKRGEVTIRCKAQAES